MYLTRALIMTQTVPHIMGTKKVNNLVMKRILEYVFSISFCDVQNIIGHILQSEKTTFFDNS